jgi:hypothetical protein
MARKWRISSGGVFLETDFGMVGKRPHEHQRIAPEVWSKGVAVSNLFPLLAMVFAQQACAEPALPPLVKPEEFQAWFEHARDGRLSISKEVEQTARRFRYVFVAGFQNERMPGYFGQNAQELRARGVPKRLIHTITPGSDETVQGNAEAVRVKFVEIASRGPEELVIVAHSRGACDALLFALQNPEFVSDRVRAMWARSRGIC